MGNRTPEQVRKHYKEYGSRPDVMKKRAMRNAARRKLMREGKVKKGDGMDVNHKRALDNGGTNARSNLNVVPKRKNRGYRRNSKNEPI